MNPELRYFGKQYGIQDNHQCFIILDDANSVISFTSKILLSERISIFLKYFFKLSLLIHAYLKYLCNSLLIK